MDGFKILASYRKNVDGEALDAEDVVEDALENWLKISKQIFDW